MAKVETIGGAVWDEGSITQLAWVIDDLDGVERTLGSMFGVRRWTRLPDVYFGPDSCVYRGAPANFTADISLAYSGDLQLELIAPGRGRSIYHEFLTDHGPGMHHVCIEPDDIDATVSFLEAEGLSVVQHGRLAGDEMRFVYLDGERSGAPVLEVAAVGPRIRALYDQIKIDSRDEETAGGR
ncbi:VOC family protein [Gordonia soli]|uniref:VOC domain-containing protein n=1 Tax=Gordonia soli NBRC 108243 TaxID=1223545 RepID=M0QEH7_9ACTN|nr:VOC family protein [Gordonia soli]GAC66839.1 hypothetical protein GS4_05_00470 [Gordonia soli NBRC 108243]